MPERRSSEPMTIVGVGASAGGLEAFKEFLVNLPADTGMAFVFVQHLDPDHDSMMVELLSQVAKVPVVTAEEAQVVQADHVYFIPPNCELSIRDGVLHVARPTAAHGLRLPIDNFFRSLAEDQEERAVGIVLSGTGTDGTLGLRAIKAHGGVIMAQTPETATYDGMPNSAVRGGSLDYVVPIADMVELLQAYIACLTRPGGGAGDREVVFPDDLLDAALVEVRVRTGQDFRQYKRSTLCRRIQRRIALRQLPGLDAYLALLRQDEAEVRQLRHDLLIGVTGFFRDPDTWEYVREHAIAQLVREHGAETPLRIWVPACSTGEEAYTVAILVQEELERNHRRLPVQIFATDVDEAALAAARAGRYPLSIAEDILPVRLRRWFVREETCYQIDPGLREQILFSRQNVLNDPPFSQLNLLSCRNLLIYIAAEVQARLLRVFHFALRPGGYLLLGDSETVGGQPHLFASLDRRFHFYRRVGTADRGQLSLAMLPAGRHRTLPGEPQGDRRRQDGLAALAQRLLLQEFAPPAVFVNSRNDILHYSGNTSPFLEQPSGSPTTDLLQLAREGLVSRLRALLHKARESGERSIAQGVRLHRDGHYDRVDLEAIPVRGAGAESSLLLVSFRPVEDQPMTGPTGAGDVSAADDAVVRQLERELVEVKEDLRSTIEALEVSNEELKASNEEVMSMNEELQSSNEELETSKEELQSLNEELTTVNSQLQEKIEQLEAANADLTNFMAASDIATLFLDGDLRIRRFTPAARKVLRLIEGDAGRPFADIVMRVDDENLLADVRAVLDDGRVRSAVVCSEDAKWYRRRALPYRRGKQQAAGVVLVFEDITDIKQARDRAEANRRRLDAALEAASLGTWEWDLATNEIQWDGCHAELLGMGSQDFDGRPETFYERVHPDDREPVRDAVLAARDEHRVYTQEYRIVRPCGAVRWMAGHGRFVYNEKGEAVRMFGAVRDVTEARAAQAELERSRRRYKEILDSITDAFFSLDRELRVTYWNPAAERALGRSADELLGKPLFDSFPEARGSIFEVRYRRSVEEDREDSFETYFEPYDEWYDVHVYPQPDGIAVYFRRTTEQKRLAAALTEKDAHLRQAEKMRVVGQLAGGIAHDFNNQLAGIMGYADMLTRQLTNDTHNRYARNIRDSAQRASDLTRKLLDFGRKGKLLSVPTDVHDVLREVIGLLHSSIDRRIRIVEELAAAAAIVLGDPNQLQNAFLNIAINARDAMLDGGRLTFSTAELSIAAAGDVAEATGLPAGQYLQIAVSDTGCGMDETALQHAFEPFYTTKPQGEGCGMGLASVYGAIANHRGAVTLESEVGEGTCVTVYLPLSTIEAAPVGPAAPAEPPRGTGCVLVVEDEAIVRNMAQLMLEELGYRVLTCANGREAVELYRREWARIDLVLLDMVMPEMDGHAALGELRRINPTVRVVFCSGYANRGQGVVDPEHGVVGFLPKPFQEVDLAETVATALKLH